MPRLGLGSIDISSAGGAGQDVVTTIDDFFFESNASGEVNPILTTSRTNLVKNSNFETDSIWVKSNATVNTTTNKGVVTVTDGAFAALNQGVVYEDGKTYTVSAVVNGTAGKKMRLQDNGANIGGLTTGNGSVTMTGSDQNVEITWVANSNSNQIVIARNDTGSYSFTISKVQVEKDGFASSFIPTSDSTVTVSTTLNDTSEVWDFDGTDITLEADPEDEGFWEEGSNLVTNHDYEDLGRNLVTNGDYSSESTGWQVEGLGWTFNNINASFSGNSFNPIRQNIGLVTGKMYKITFTLNISSGNMIFQLGGDTTTYTTSGTYTIYREATSHPTLSSFISIYSNTTSVFTIDNVSVKQVDPNDRWSLTNTTISDGVLNFPDNSSAAKFALHSNTSMMDIGSAYEITLTVNKTAGGVLKVLSGTGASVLTPDVSISSSGTQTFRVTNNTNGGKLFLYTTAGENFQGTVDNVTVREYAVQPKDI